MNSKISKKLGTPHNLSDRSGQRKTQAAGRPAVNSNIVNNKWGEAPNDYGTSDHGVKGWKNRGMKS